MSKLTTKIKWVAQCWQCNSSAAEARERGKCLKCGAKWYRGAPVNPAKIEVTLTIECGTPYEDGSGRAATGAEILDYVTRYIAGRTCPPQLPGVMLLISVKEEKKEKCKGCGRAAAFAQLVKEGHYVHPSNVSCSVHGKAK